jgi:hypothetical protein
LLSAFLLFSSSFSFLAASTSPHLRWWIDFFPSSFSFFSFPSSFFSLLGVNHLRALLSDRRSILLTEMWTEKLVASTTTSAREPQDYFLLRRD